MLEGNLALSWGCSSATYPPPPPKVAVLLLHIVGWSLLRPSINDFPLTCRASNFDFPLWSAVHVFFPRARNKRVSARVWLGIAGEIAELFRHLFAGRMRLIQLSMTKTIQCLGDSLNKLKTLFSQPCNFLATQRIQPDSTLASLLDPTACRPGETTRDGQMLRTASRIRIRLLMSMQ